MGLTNFKGKKPTKQEAGIAKNYLNEEEIGILNRLVSAYLDIAEINAMRRKSMSMNDWIDVLDGFIKMSRQDILTNAGTVSAKLAKQKVQLEFDDYRKKAANDLSAVELQFLKSLEQVERKLKSKK